jgi:hypothetical protein
MAKRLKSGPRTPYGYLDAALGDLIDESLRAGYTYDVLKKRRAIIQRVRRIVRAEVQRERQDAYAAFQRYQAAANK